MTYPTIVNRIARKMPTWFSIAFVLISLLHIGLVIFNIKVIGYTLSVDSHKYLHIADEFLGRYAWSPLNHCNTSPGYPVFLTLIKLLSINSTLMIGIIQAMLFCVSLMTLLYTLVQRGYFSYTHALVSGALILISPEFFTFNGYILTESLTASLLLLVSACILQKPERVPEILYFSILMAALVAVKFEYIVLLPLALWLLNRPSFDLSKIAIPMVVMAISLSMNGVRNQYFFDRFSISGFGGGVVMYGGNNLNGDGSWHSYFSSADYLPDQQMQELIRINQQDECIACPQRDSLFKSLAWHAWKADPVLQIRLIPVKFAKLWLFPAEFDPFTAASGYAPDLKLSQYFSPDRSLMQNLLYNKYLLLYWMLTGLSLTGMAVRFFSHKPGAFDLIAVYCLIVFSALYAIPFYGLPRFHLPFTPLMLMYGAFPILMLGSLMFRKLRPGRDTRD